MDVFNYLYKKYKVEILKKNTWISELRTYERVALVMIILGGILSGVFVLLKMHIGSYIALGMMIVGLIFGGVFKCRKKEERSVKEILEPAANERMRKMINLLLEFEIDISNEEQLNGLIEHAQKVQAKYDVWKGVKKAFSGMTTYILLPVITIFLSEFFKEIGWKTLVVRAGVLLMVCTGIVLIISAFALSIKNVLNPDIRNLDYFIRDTEEVKLFSVKAIGFVNEKENTKEKNK